jgi:hypothetical protein
MTTRQTAQADEFGLPAGSGISAADRVFHSVWFGNAVAKSSSMKGTSGTNVVGSWNQHFVRSGEGAMTALARSGGGTRLLAESSDSAIGCLVKPRINSVFTTTKWDTADEPHFECLIRTGTNVTTIAIQAGLMLTGAMNGTTDANQVKFLYTAGATTLKVVTSITGTDATHDTGVELAASTLYRLTLKVGADRTVKAFVNGKHAYGVTTSALTTAINLVPIVGVASDGAAADPFIDLYRISMSKVAN